MYSSYSMTQRPERRQRASSLRLALGCQEKYVASLARCLSSLHLPEASITFFEAGWVTQEGTYVDIGYDTTVFPKQIQGDPCPCFAYLGKIDLDLYINHLHSYPANPAGFPFDMPHVQIGPENDSQPNPAGERPPGPPCRILPIFTVSLYLLYVLRS